MSAQEARRPAGDRETDQATKRPRTTDRKQTGCCYEAQADGIPCPGPDCDCENCARADF